VDELRATFSLVPDYLQTAEQGVTNLMDLGVQLGRRFRALKLWMVIRAFGVDGLRQRIRFHCELARRLASWIEGDRGFELVAPVPFSLVCFRARLGASENESDSLNEKLLELVNAEGPVLLSHTKLGGRYVLRAALGNLRTTEETIRTAWEILKQHAASLG
jgi:aromatic-L-amino-acid decarboxylase